MGRLRGGLFKIRYRDFFSLSNWGSWLLKVFLRDEATVSPGVLLAERGKQLQFQPGDTESERGTETGHYASPVVFYLFTLYRS